MGPLASRPTDVAALQPPYERHPALVRALKVLRGGGLVAFPTETFYGLAADIRQEAALRSLYAAKGRDPGEPLLILVDGAAAVDQLALRVDPLARRLMHVFWPGGLTLVFEAGPSVSRLLTAGTGKIGIRWSSHAVAAALPAGLGCPVTGTSANRSGSPPCVDAREVEAQLGGRVDLILDGGRTAGLAPSTVLDVSGDRPRILRRGVIPEDVLMQVIGAGCAS
ncbi:L-threonylcarbamoyladenylate synthase [Desulfatiglans anilini]|uniref:L-threonylcarbamoyladenylate synthase n=1 Tax=Desulfatiglans anilini TaxID=90728 RepID=UPI000A04D946|nr:L-threonylcarbamoyladenylate synthase [Desulfatiglans anilini]